MYIYIIKHTKRASTITHIYKQRGEPTAYVKQDKVLVGIFNPSKHTKGRTVKQAVKGDSIFTIAAVRTWNLRLWDIPSTLL
jgi:hypothetical protein